MTEHLQNYHIQTIDLDNLPINTRTLNFLGTPKDTLENSAKQCLNTRMGSEG